VGSRKFPRGKLRADDEGQLAMRLAIQDGTLLVIFPKPVTWFGLGPNEVEGLIKLLEGKLAELRRAGA